MTNATVADVLEILNRHAGDVIRILGLPIRQVQLSMPMDEGEPRIKVSVSHDTDARVPKSLSFDLEGRKVRVPLEKARDFQIYRLH